MAMAENQSAHRMAMEKKALHDADVRSRLGLAAGFALALVLIFFGSGLIYLDHDTAGTTVITGTVVSLAGVFVIGKTMTQTDLRRKAARAQE